LDPVSPRVLNPSVPRDLETICLKCLEKEPGKRYATAASLAEDLRRFLDQQPIVARPLSLGERGVKWARRRPAVAGLLGTLITVVLLGVAGLTGLLLQLHGETQAARAAKQDADAARLESDRQRGLAVEALAESEKRLVLNYVAYGQICATASRLANVPDWEDGKEAREKFEHLSNWLLLAADPDVRHALQTYVAELAQWHAGPPPPALQQASLRLAHACRDSWLKTVEEETPERAAQLRSQLYARVRTVVERMAAAPRWEEAASLRRDFWELYWGELAFVESNEVEQIMVQIGNVLTQWQPGTPPPGELKQRADELRAACVRPASARYPRP
jgi:hypothetical protein